MTKKELKTKMLEFINSCDNLEKDEDYCTDQVRVRDVLERFAEEVGITLQTPEK